MPLQDETPTFEFSSADGPLYEQPYEFNGAYGNPWMSDSTAMVPSPTNTVRTQWTGPANFQRSGNIGQARSSMDSRLQQNLPRLDTRQPPAAQPGSDMLNPMLFYQQGSEPWNAFGGMRNPQDSVQNNFLHAGVNYGQHRRGTCSDAGSNVPASDSGYYTHQTLSVLSDEHSRVHQELPPALLDQAKNLNVARSPTGSLRRPSDQRSVLSYHSGRSAIQRHSFPCREEGCSAVSKCASEHKKHMLKHEKNFICDVPDCRRAGKGFSTINDLDRHKKSVHKMGIEKSKSYMCAASGCENKNKMWPRLDNFKQHIERMHKGDDPIELIRRSEYLPREPLETQQSLVVDPALLAGIGGPNHVLNSSGSHVFPYQSTVSFHATSMSTAASHHSSFNASLSMDTTHPSTNSSFPSSTGNVSNVSFDRRGSAKATPTSMPVTNTPAPEAHNREQMQLSAAPQTKVEQQNQALAARLSQSNINIEELVDRVLSAQRQSSSSPPPSPTTKLHTTRIITDFLTQPPKPQSRRPTPGYAPTTQYCEFARCNFSGRPCDLKKHMKRHRKPYGCTYPSCHKRFGAKSDWKRHENSQHFQLEAFRCDVSRSSGKCAQHFHLPWQFASHLRETHGITTSAQVEAISERCKIGKNCQGQYWCGFCREIVELKRKRNKAWDERFDHIARHLEKEKRRFDEWVCVERNMTKRQLQEEMNPCREEVLEADGVRGAPDQINQKTVFRQCCQCKEISTLIQVDCFACEHDFCTACKRVYGEDG